MHADNVFDMAKHLVSPKKYWSDKYAELTKKVDIIRRNLVACRLDLESARMTRQNDIRARILEGATPEDAVYEWKSLYQAGVELCKGDFEDLRETIAKQSEARSKMGEP